jgi:hypothetical protein
VHEDNESSNHTLLNAVINHIQIDDARVHHVMNGNSHLQKKIPTRTATKSDNAISHSGSQYRKINMLHTSYRINTNNTEVGGYALVDGGANGRLFGSDVQILHHTLWQVTITGIDNHQLGDLPVCTGAAYGLTQHGPVIFIMHQYAYLGQGKSIHSSGQLESFHL